VTTASAADFTAPVTEMWPKLGTEAMEAFLKRSTSRRPVIF
jgi:hypothetical protein